MLDAGDVLQLKMTDIPECPLCGGAHAEAPVRLSDDREWDFEVTCPVTGQTYLARKPREAPPCPQCPQPPNG